MICFCLDLELYSAGSENNKVGFCGLAWEWEYSLLFLARIEQYAPMTETEWYFSGSVFSYSDFRKYWWKIYVPVLPRTSWFNSENCRDLRFLSFKSLLWHWFFSSNACLKQQNILVMHIKLASLRVKPSYSTLVNSFLPSYDLITDEVACQTFTPV